MTSALAGVTMIDCTEDVLSEKTISDTPTQRLVPCLLRPSPGHPFVAATGLVALWVAAAVNAVSWVATKGFLFCAHLWRGLDAMLHGL